MKGLPVRCIFCSGAGLSREHLWSDWMSPLFTTKPSGEKHAWVSATSIGASNDHIEVKDARLHQRHGHRTNTKLKVVCLKCNNRWMSDIERNAKPFLLPMMLGTVLDISLDAQRAIATWIALKVMVAEYLDPRWVAVSPFERHFMFEKREPPPNWRIRIAPLHESALRWRTSYHHYSNEFIISLSSEPINPRRFTGRPNVQSTTFGFGDVFSFTSSSTIDVAKFNPDLVGAPDDIP